jgi:2-C-methyl-D-erythritol 4-phosphate cytidylyltransferase
MSGKTPLRFALIVAGGTGTRMGGEVPKQLLPLRGKPILIHTVERFLRLGPNVLVCLALHPSLLERWPALLAQYLREDAHRITAIAGGATRTLSVDAGLRACTAQAQGQPALVAIHDAVRPIVSQALLESAYAMALEKGNAVVCVPVKSSMRRKEGDASVAVDRSLYYHVQTPQVFRLNELTTAFQRRPHDEFTDDASLAEEMGIRIHICEGSYDNLKITTPEDMAVAEQLLSAMSND